MAQEFQRVWAAYRRETSTAAPQFTFAKADRRVTCYYFYLWDEGFGPAFIKVCAYFPTRPKSGSTGTSGPNARPPGPGSPSPSCPTASPPARTRPGLQEICDRAWQKAEVELQQGRVGDPARLKRENAELRRANEILKAASAFFAELDRSQTR